MKAIRWAVMGLTSVLGSAAFADVKLPAVFSDNMVLQKGEKIPVFGWADSGEAVTVKAGAQSAQATAGADGKWKVTLDTTKVDSARPFEVTVAGKNNIAIKNVLVGEVWVASGQSNMEMSVNGVKNAADENKAADFPAVRMFTVKKATSDTALKDVTGTWVVAEPGKIGGFSAVGYFFARELNQTLKVPVGVIHTSWGGTVAEAWTSPEALKADADFEPILDRYTKAKEGYPAAKARYEEAVKAWEAGGKKGNAPRGPGGPNNPNNPSVLYNAMVSPLIPYGIRGAIWYQGESNAGRAYQYRKLFPAMITDWRKQWAQGDFPFYFVQLANFQAKTDQPGDSAWAELREAQTMTLKLQNTGQAVIIDIGDDKDIHPKNKQDVGKRLAQWALKKDYGRDVEDSGPLFDSIQVEGDAVRVNFTHASGLTAKGDKLTSFAVAGEDKKFVWADAKIEGNSVVVKSPAVAKPVAVRYGWANNPDANLYNGAGLPASPFRSDEWPGITAAGK